MAPNFNTADVETVDKETLANLQFPHDDVLKTEAERRRRTMDAERAATLGNAYHGKLDIYFQTADGATKRVQTTIWGAHQEYLSLKSGVSLPLRAVLGFDFY